LSPHPFFKRNTMYSKNIIIQCISLFLLLGFTPSHGLAAAPDTELPSGNKNLNKTKSDEVKQDVQYQSVEERRLYTLLQTERDNLENEKKVLALKEKELKTLHVEADKKLKLLKGVAKN